MTMMSRTRKMNITGTILGTNTTMLIVPVQPKPKPNERPERAQEEHLPPATTKSNGISTLKSCSFSRA